MKKLALFLVFLFLVTGTGIAGVRTFNLDNGNVKLSIIIGNEHIEKEILENLQETSKVAIITTGDFALNVMWTGWRAPGKVNNSENPVVFTGKDFVFIEGKTIEEKNGEKKLFLEFKGKDRIPFKLVITYSLRPGDFFVRRKITVSDSKTGLHFLRKIYPYRAEILNPYSVVKDGGYGQPVAIRTASGGAFWGIEYPAATSLLNGKELVCYQYMGEKITDGGVSSDWTVFGITPDTRVKYWFFMYLNRIRVAPLKPYLLYNSWYDLRAPEMVKSPEYVMNEKNTKRIIKLFKRNMTDSYGITLDAFVLDDGWDVYRSDWQLSRKQFPRGLKPISDLLKKTNTKLGIWFGPTGGYSHRSWRISWMREHGYETVGDQMCFGGKNYSSLFEKRVLEFIEKYNVGYYKWDGFQFSCSEPDHGHPVGIYSRRAILNRLIEIVRAVREKNPDVFLNITSGTWLSPWWLLYANTIWMQGYDYGYAGVPSISRRDRAMTYRDYVLYDDLKNNNFWFPVANLMTHGIIKGHLQKLGGEREPIDKFTNNAVLYFARGISMYELYISPDLLTHAEWKALARSIKWARDRFDVLTHYTEMIGGNPGEGRAYGYVHFKGTHGIIALRNPVMVPQSIKVKLAPEAGFSENASNLVLERVYPSRWIFPHLYSSGQVIEIPLSGYETAIYEIYPLKEAKIPLIAGAEFSMKKAGNNRVIVRIYRSEGNPVLLNPEIVSSIKYNLKELDPSRLPEFRVSFARVSYRAEKLKGELRIKLNMGKRIGKATLAILLKPGRHTRDKDIPAVKFLLDGKSVMPAVEKQKGAWAWYRIPLGPGSHRITVNIRQRNWNLSTWLIYRERFYPRRLIIETKRNVILRPMPPLPWKSGTVVKKLRINFIP